MNTPITKLLIAWGEGDKEALDQLAAAGEGSLDL